MLNMSKAAIAPNLPYITEKDRSHPSFSKYETYRQSRIQLGINCQSFSQWLNSTAIEEYRDEWANHPRYPEFQKWMHTEKPGLTNRRCRPSKDLPHGLSFPENFKVWLTGERW